MNKETLEPRFQGMAGRQRAEGVLRDTASRLERKAKRLRVLADLAATLETGSDEEEALWDVATSAH